jgi:hypothetical protein
VRALPDRLFDLGRVLGVDRPGIAQSPLAEALAQIEDITDLRGVGNGQRVAEPEVGVRGGRGRLNRPARRRRRRPRGGAAGGWSLQVGLALFELGQLLLGGDH